MHAPSHLRIAFLDWLDDDRPRLVKVQKNYVLETETTAEFLRRFIRQPCSDYLPADAKAKICGWFEVEEPRRLSYVIAAAVLLIDEEHGPSVAADVLRTLAREVE